MNTQKAYHVLGVVADTHVPDRVNALHPGLLSALKSAGVEQILHAGDACIRQVIEELESVAPVTVVRGNRDWMLSPLPPWRVTLELNGVRVAMAHGQGSFFTYWLDKFFFVFQGYRFERYQRVVATAAPEADVYVFGHTHRAENRMDGGRLFFNPGSASFGFIEGSRHPSFGLLTILPDGRVQGEICPLNGWRVVQGRWERV